MLKKYLFFILFWSITAFGNEFLNPEDAFKVNVQKNTDSIVFTMELDKSVYVYDEFLKVTLQPSNIDITKELKIQKPIDYHDFLVHFDTLTINVPLTLINKKVDSDSYEVIFEYQGCSKDGLCYSPMQKTYSSTTKNTETSTPQSSLLKKTSEPLIKEKVIETQTVNETDTIAQTLKEGNITLILLTFFGFGVLLALTPCVFPMIPILSSIIVRQSETTGQMTASKGFLLSVVYVLSMSLAYTFAGVMAGLFGANIQAMLQNPFVIVSFAAIFVALAFSMFGYYEIGLPSSWMSKINKASDNSSRHGGFLSVAIMGFLSALIVGPCVAPPLAGALLYIGQTGDAILGGLALFVMSIGMGLPLLFVGLGAGKYMPKPGGWMSVVSKVFGVVMLGIAIWMLDRVVPFMITFVLTVTLLMGSAFYLIKNGNKFGKIIAALLMVASTAFVMFNMKQDTTSKLHFQYVKTKQELQMVINHSSKPVLVDFWATWCVSCKEFDNITFKDKNVQKELEKYTLIKIDVTKNTKDDKELLEMFSLFGPPAILFFEKGQEIKNKKIVGYKNPQEFMEIIK